MKDKNSMHKPPYQKSEPTPTRGYDMSRGESVFYWGTLAAAFLALVVVIISGIMK